MKYIYICIYIYIYMYFWERWTRIVLGGGKALYFHSFQCLQVYSDTCSTGVQETILGVLQTCLAHFGENWKIALRCSKLASTCSTATLFYSLFYSHRSRRRTASGLCTSNTEEGCGIEQTIHDVDDEDECRLLVHRRKHDVPHPVRTVELPQAATICTSC